jgi:hypothetical protein
MTREHDAKTDAACVSSTLAEVADNLQRYRPHAERLLRTRRPDLASARREAAEFLALCKAMDDL